MKNISPDEGVRTRLILSALDELLEHGITDFSLRRVATIAQVSCAAPYRHFKSKEELITETARYITSKWSLIAEQIISVHGADKKKTLVELSKTAVKFWVANGNFRSLLLTECGSPLLAEMREFDRLIIEYVKECAKIGGLSDEEAEEKERLVLVLIYGNILLAGAGKITPDIAALTVGNEVAALF